MCQQICALDQVFPHTAAGTRSSSTILWQFTVAQPLSYCSNIPDTKYLVSSPDMNRNNNLDPSFRSLTFFFNPYKTRTQVEYTAVHTCL